MKYIRKPANKFNSEYCFICSGNCHNECEQQDICHYISNDGE